MTITRPGARAQRACSHANYTAVPYSTAQTAQIFVDDSVNAIRFVVAGKQEDADLLPSGCGYIRRVGIKPPSAHPPYPISRVPR